MIADKKSPFVSRGDDSGTHIKEQFLWKESGLPLKEVKKMIAKKGGESEVQYVAPEGDWYFSIGQGMGAALMMADEKRAYCLADRGTYLAYRGKINLDILGEGDPRLYNPYGVIAVNPERFPQVQYFGAMSLIAWMTSVEGQKIIADFRKEGEVLFHPLAMRPDLLVDGKRWNICLTGSGCRTADHPFQSGTSEDCLGIDPGFRHGTSFLRPGRSPSVSGSPSLPSRENGRR